MLVFHGHHTIKDTFDPVGQSVGEGNFEGHGLYVTPYFDVALNYMRPYMYVFEIDGSAVRSFQSDADIVGYFDEIRNYVLSNTGYDLLKNWGFRNVAPLYESRVRNAFTDENVRCYLIEGILYNMIRSFGRHIYNYGSTLGRFLLPCGITYEELDVVRNAMRDFDKVCCPAAYELPYTREKWVIKSITPDLKFRPLMRYCKGSRHLLEEHPEKKSAKFYDKEFEKYFLQALPERNNPCLKHKFDIFYKHFLKGIIRV